MSTAAAHRHRPSAPVLLIVGLWLVMLALVAGCTTPVQHAIPPAPPDRPTIFGMPGEDVTHLEARLIARACGGTELEHVVEDTTDFLSDCADDGYARIACEREACRKIRRATSPHPFGDGNETWCHPMEASNLPRAARHLPRDDQPTE